MSDSDEENVIRYGTPLEPFEEDEIPSKRKYQQAPDQYAVDDHGRRRFHGAFTGGFSAGYGNTVGTAEGWTPATFKSSRGEKASASNQRPEDFMDDEDRSEFGIAPRHMQTNSDFAGQKRKLHQSYHDGPIPGEPVLEQLVRAVHETAAVRMLRAMGWKEGQGIGERVTRNDKGKAKDQHKVYGCYLPKELQPAAETVASEDNSSDEGGEIDYKTLFAPDDYEPYVLQRKNDRFGLGYSGLSRHSVLGSLAEEYGSGASSSKSHLRMKEKGKKVSIRGQAFGVGAFEADDDDIYATEDMSHYDFTLGGATKDIQNKKPVVKDKSSRVLEGFVPSRQPLPSVPLHPPPALPRDYIPVPAHTRRTRFEPTHHEQRDQGLGRHELTAQARGEILGEEPLQKPPEANKPTEDPIAKLTGRNVNFVTTVKENADTALDFISIKDTGKEVPKAFKPFASDVQKQGRYEMYLKSEGSGGDIDGGSDRLSDWERNRELVEFEQAAKLYKPLTGVMGDRFTHASQPDEAVNALCAVARSSTNYGLASQEMTEAAEKGFYGIMTRRQSTWRPESLVCKRFNIPDPYVTRPESKKEDKPKLSYSIFSYLESSVHDRNSFAKEQSKFSGSKSLSVDNALTNTLKQPPIHRNVDDKVTKLDEVNVVPVETAPGFSKRLTVAELFMKESEKDLKTKEKATEITETIDKFDKMELYKAIFLSDTEDEEESGNKEDANTKSSDISDFVEVPKNVERNTSPPRGIFANIDFDELNSWRRKADKVTVSNEPEDPTKNVNKPLDSVDNVNKETGNNVSIKEASTVDIEGETYGPKIPENLLKRIESSEVETNPNDNFRPKFKSKNQRGKDDKSELNKNKIVEIDSSSSDSWVDAEEVKRKKEKKKKRKKTKSKHKKSKHKKKSK